MIRRAAVCLLMIVSTQAQAIQSSDGTPEATATERVERLLFAQRRSCKAVSSCREAVEMWCGGYAGADRDDDGIPCENVCTSKAQVDKIKKEIGC